MKNTDTKLLGLLLMCQLLIVLPSIQSTSTSPATPTSSAHPTTSTDSAATTFLTDAPTNTASPPITTTTTTPPPTTTTTTEAPTITTPPTTPLPTTTTKTEATTTTSATMTSQTQPTPTSTLAPTTTPTMPPTTTTPPAQETSTAATPSATSQPEVQSSTTSVSAVTKPSASGNATTSSSTTTASPATTAAPSTTTAKSAYPTKQPEKPFQVVLHVGGVNDCAVYCKVDINCTFGNIASKMRDAFSTVPGYLYLREGTSTGNRRKRDTRFSVDVLFDFQKLTNLRKAARRDAMYRAMQKLNEAENVGVNMSLANTTAVARFAAADLCAIPEVCPRGYMCEREACHHLCENHDCGNNGVCNTLVNADGSASAQCVCNSDDEHTYSGDRCQEEETSKAKVASIVGGVLGAFCALFLIVILFLAYCLWNRDGGSKRKYQLGGYSNNGYADHEFAMKNVGAD